MNKKIIIGSRGSKLAIIQSNIIAEKIKSLKKQYEIDIMTIKTTGDMILDKSLDKIGGKGLFVKELDKALISKEIDITVHSLKDIPTLISDNIPIIGFSEREAPFDCLVLPKGKKEIDFSKPIGSSSKRRTIQIKSIYKNAFFKPIRGNVITRLKKLDSGEFSALILAEAGLLRLGLNNRISRVFSPDEVVPAAGQGIIAIQGRIEENYDYINSITSKNSKICAYAERAFIKEFDAGCSSPIAAYAEIIKNKILLRAFYADDKNIIKTSIEGDINNPKNIGITLAKKIKEML